MKTKKKAGRPIGTTGKARAISDKELDIVLKVTMAGNHGLRNSAMVILTHYLGLRAMEVASLKIGDVYDFKTGELMTTLRLIPSYTKGKTPREISLANTRVISALEKYIDYRKSCDYREMRPDDPLFRSQGRKHFSPNSIALLFIRLYNDAGLTRASSHSGRRSLITKLSEAGVDLYSISKIAGHQSIETTARYVSENPERLRNILMNI